MGIGIYIGNTVGQSSSPYWTQRLSLKYSSRSGLNLLETKSGSNLNAKLLPVVGKVDATNYTSLNTNDFGLADASGYVEIKFYYNGDNSKVVPLFCSVNAAGTAYILIYCHQGRFYCFFGANILSYTLEGGAGWYTCRLSSNNLAYSLTVNGVAKTLTIAGGSDNGNWFDSVANRTSISVGAVMYTVVEAATMSALIDYIDYNGTNKWYFTGFGTKIFDVVGGLHMAWTGSGHADFSGNDNQCLNIGYSVWQKSGSADEYVPYISANTPYDASAALSGYAKYRDYPGSATAYNLYPSLVGFNETSSADAKLAIFDRSNTTRQSATSRAGIFYDATSLATKSRYYCSPTSSPFAPEFKYETLKTFFNTGYKHMIFSKRNTALQTAITEINILDTDLSNNSLLQKALDYCNIKGFIAFGDSITSGPSATTRYSYLVAANKAIEEINSGVPSDAVQIELVARVGNLAAYAENSRIFILCGINDIDHIVNDSPLGTDAAFIAAYNTIIDSLVSYGFVKRNIYISTLTWLAGDSYGYRDYVVPYNTLITNIASNKGVHLIDLYSVTENQPTFFTGAEELHPNATGHQAIATEILSRITWW